jgi:nucleotide-binding universal stress UspA family protein
MNFVMSRILVPVDFSPHSDAAVRYATAVAQRLGASMDLLHVVEEPTTTCAQDGQGAGRRPAQPREAAIQAAEHALEQYRDTADSHPVSVMTTVRTGPAGRTIATYAKDIGASLIVMGAQGRNGVSCRSIGRAAELVVRHAPCPVLTLRGNEALATSASIGATGEMILGWALGRNGASRE